MHKTGRTAARCLLAMSALLCGCMSLGGERDERDERDERYEVVYEQACAEASCADDFVFSDPETWRMHPYPQGPALELPERAHIALHIGRRSASR